MLSEIRARNDGNRPNILYILIDDVGFGQMGNRTLNSVMGIETPNINRFAKEGHEMMIAKYPHAKLGKGRPYEGIENLCPESKAAVEHFMSWQPKGE